ncbi:MAG: ATP-dependent Clp protease adaptor ClpS [Dehalococcoidia bacterium]
MAEQTTTPETSQEEAPAPTLERQYHLVLLNDDDHTYQYVIEMLGAVLGYQPEKAFAIACVVDSEGRATVETASHEQVTGHQRQIHGYGPDPRVRRCRGSMSAIVEPVK